VGCEIILLIGTFALQYPTSHLIALAMVLVL